MCQQTEMNSSPPKQKVSTETLQSQNSPGSLNNTQYQQKLVLLMKSHPIIKTLSHQKVYFLKKHLQESDNVRVNKSLKFACKNFVDKISPQLLQILTQKTYQQFALFLKNQKRADDQEYRRIGELITNWQAYKKQSSQQSPMKKFLEKEKTRFDKVSQ